MGTKNFTQFSTASPLTASDYVVGYKADGSAEIKTQVQSIINLVATLPTTTNYLSTNNVILSSITLSNTLLGATSATSIGIGSLSARTITLVHDPANDGVDPIFDIGETQTGSFSGFRIRYEEPSNRFIGSSRTGTTILTSFIITTNTGQVGISGAPAPGQALTVNGGVSATAIQTSSLTATNTLLTNLTVSTPVIANYGVINVTSSKTFTTADNSQVFHFDTTSSSLCAIFPNTLPNGFNAGITNIGTGTIFLSSDVTINAPGTQNSTSYSGMFIYKVNNFFYGVGVFS